MQTVTTVGDGDRAEFLTAVSGFAELSTRQHLHYMDKWSSNSSCPKKNTRKWNTPNDHLINRSHFFIVLFFYYFHELCYFQPTLSPSPKERIPGPHHPGIMRKKSWCVHTRTCTCTYNAHREKSMFCFRKAHRLVHMHHRPAFTREEIVIQKLRKGWCGFPGHQRRVAGVSVREMLGCVLLCWFNNQHWCLPF